MDPTRAITIALIFLLVASASISFAFAKDFIKQGYNMAGMGSLFNAHMSMLIIVLLTFKIIMVDLK